MVIIITIGVIVIIVTRNGLSCQVTWQVMWPPHGHRHTVTATRPSHPWPGHVPGHVISHVPGCAGTFDHGNLPRAFGLRALLAALGPPALTATPSSLAHGHSFLVANTLRQPWPMAAFVSRRPLAPVAPSALGGLQPTAASGSWGTLGHDRLLGRRRY